MRLILDPAACDGFGFCAELLPDHITLDEWGFPMLRVELEEEDLTAARAAVRCCPRRALRITESVPAHRP